MASEIVEFRLIEESGLTSVKGIGPRTELEREIRHYAMQYSQDGPIKIQMRVEGGKWTDYQLQRSKK